MKNLHWSRYARNDLLAIGQYIAWDNRAAARRWVERLRERARAAARTPGSGRRVPELERDDIREVFLRNYRIVYQILENEVLVLTVFEGHRQFPRDVMPSERTFRYPTHYAPRLPHQRLGVLYCLSWAPKWAPKWMVLRDDEKNTVVTYT